MFGLCMRDRPPGVKKGGRPTTGGSAKTAPFSGGEAVILMNREPDLAVDIAGGYR